MQTTTPEKSPCILVAANRLPLSVVGDDNAFKFVESPGGLVSAMKGVDLKMDWIGWPGSEIPEERQPELADELTRQSDHFALQPVFLTKEDQDLYYNGFANQMIWPNFHDLCAIMHYSEAHWRAYQQVNQKFADKIYVSLQEHAVKTPGEGALVWVHDYQLMLVPGILRARLQAAPIEGLERVKIGFFLHVPFPCHEVFAKFPEKIRREIIRGLIAADLIGVHEQTYLDNFLENARLDGSRDLRILNADKKCILNESHVTHLDVYPIGIEPGVFEGCVTRSAPAVRPCSKLLHKYENSKIILGVDRLDPSKGLMEKFLGYEEFLANHPQLRGRTALVQIAVPSRTAIADYAELKTKLFEKAAEINEKFGVPGCPPPVELLYQNFGVADLTDFYRMADTLLITSIKDGMNLVSFEYTICQQRAQPTEKQGNLILSRHAGAASYLLGALQVDPHDVSDIARAIQRALTMPRKEKEVRQLANFAYVKNKTAKQWANEFITDLRNLEVYQPINLSLAH